MPDNIIALLGSARFEPGTLHRVANEFGWTVGIAKDLGEVVAAQPSGKMTTVLFHRGAFGSGSWLEAIRMIQFALPGARPVACHGFSESIDWPALCDAGAFHSLWLPLQENEVRRTFGFVWEAEKRLTPIVPRGVPAQDLALAS